MDLKCLYIIAASDVIEKTKLKVDLKSKNLKNYFSNTIVLVFI